MKVMIETCCGINVHQQSIVCCILDGPLDTRLTKENSEEILDDYYHSSKCFSLVVRKSVTHVFFESTGQYWAPLFNIFSDSDLVLVLTNPHHIKNVSG